VIDVDYQPVNQSDWRRYAVRVTKVTLGIFCLLLGVVGLFLPFLQGILFLIVGLTLLSSESDFARRWLLWLRRRVSIGRTGQGESSDDR